jgi:hypothetical protein
MIPYSCDRLSRQSYTIFSYVTGHPMRAQLLSGYVQSVFDLHLLHLDFVFS